MQVYSEEAAASGSAELEAVARVLSSRTFSKAPRLCSLFEFIAAHSVTGRHQDLTEQRIGVQVFGRTPGYNSSDDTIVRGTARHLRQRLDQYYSSEGVDDRIHIKIPRGGYVASFEERSPPLKDPDPTIASLGSPEQTSTPPVRLERAWVLWALVSVTVLLVVVSTGLAVAYLKLKQRAQRDEPRLSGPASLWNALFTGDRKTLIVPGDAGLDTYVAWEQKDISLEEYSSQSYQQHATVSVPPTHMDVPLSARSVTPMADLVFVTALVRASEQMGNPRLSEAVEVRYARNLVVAETHDNNLILIGSETFNPWVKLYQPQMDFQAHFDFGHDVYRIVNRLPKAGEQPEYEYVRKISGPQKALTHIALLNNDQGLGRVLVVEGTSMGTTYGAVNFLTYSSLWGPVLQQATDRDGKLRNFEVLLSGDFFHGGMGNTRVIALHVH